MEHVHRRQSGVHKKVEEDLGVARIELKYIALHSQRINKKH